MRDIFAAHGYRLDTKYDHKGYIRVTLGTTVSISVSLMHFESEALPEAKRQEILKASTVTQRIILRLALGSESTVRTLTGIIYLPFLLLLCPYECGP
eukprot:m.231694 g.231694  ORF g.231694 m.231694 type:complete len:97 (-) comp16009_c0_seq5:6-296(-)